MGQHGLHGVDLQDSGGERDPDRPLTGNGITVYGNGTYSLIGASELSDDERDELLDLCRQRLDAFRARGRCECCGAHKHEYALEVNHIIPSNAQQCRQVRHGSH
ncbi:HNH endonuclease [Synechococcus sp. J7-Johnson]|nr:HNH endonuclease [Synechococcus sp. J7-Johnson]